MNDTSPPLTDRNPLAALRRVSVILPTLSLTLVAGISAWSWAVFPEKRGNAVFTTAVFALCVMLMESKRPGDRSAVDGQKYFMRLFFAGAALIMTIKTGTKLAIATNLIEPSWLSPTQRSSGVLLGVLFVLFGNYLPKLSSPWSLADEPFDWQGVHRFVAWVCSLAGVAIVIAWPAFPDSAAQATIPVLLTMAVMALSRKFYSLATWRGHRPS